MCSNIMHMVTFEWDPAKARRNLAKHGVSVLNDRQRRRLTHWRSCIRSAMRPGDDTVEAIGRAGTHLVLVVAHTARHAPSTDIIRIISARRALRHERQRYEDQAY